MHIDRRGIYSVQLHSAALHKKKSQILSDWRFSFKNRLVIGLSCLHVLAQRQELMTLKSHKAYSIFFYSKQNQKARREEAFLFSATEKKVVIVDRRVRSIILKILHFTMQKKSKE